MKTGYELVKIEENTQISKNIFKMKVLTNAKALPGQFYMIRTGRDNHPLLSRAISVSDVSSDYLTFLYQAKGTGTKLMSEYKAGESIKILGPLGNGFDLDIAGRVAVVGGGIGIAPLYYLAKSLKNAEIDIFIGFRDESYFSEEFCEISSNIYIYSDTGKSGKKGFVTMDIDTGAYDRIYGCGPAPMIRALCRICSDKTKLFLSLERNMACGIGACLGCNVMTADGVKRVCKDGPVFRADQFLTKEDI